MDSSLFHDLKPELLIPIVGILMPIGLVAVIFVFVQRLQAQRHAHLVELLEKGLMVPPELLQPRSRLGSPRMRAMTLVGVGIGTSAFLGAMFQLENGLWAAGLIPLAVGVAQLLALKWDRPEAGLPPAPRERSAP